MDAGTAIGVAVLAVDFQNMFLDKFILHSVLAERPDQTVVICCPGNLQDPAHRLDTELARVLPDKPIDHFGVLEKMAVAFYT
jgi:hypothetical protein